MDKNQQELITKAIVYLREHDKALSRKLRPMKYKTPWEIDAIRLQWRDKKELVPVDLFGREIWLTGDKSFKPEDGRVVVDIGDIFLLQFFDTESLNKIFSVYEVFGKMNILNIDNKEVDQYIDYSNKMDEKIVQSFFKLRQNKVSDIFINMWKEVGGDHISEADGFGKRIWYYKEMIERYKVDKPSYTSDLVRLKLLGSN